MVFLAIIISLLELLILTKPINSLIYKYTEIDNILKTYMDKYYHVNDKETWFNNIKLMCDELGYASNMKEYKKNPDAFKGNVADVSTVLRVALTSKAQTPDLYEIMKLFGKDRILKRYNLK